MMPPRGLSASEAASWRRVAETVTPLVSPREGDHPRNGGGAPARIEPSSAGADAHLPLPRRSGGPPPRAGENLAQRTLDGTWERKLGKAQIAPDFEIDLHGDTLDRAYTRLMASLGRAISQEARLVLVIAGKPRPHGQERGAIRAKLLDWLAASPHASRIAAVRPAAQRHGGAGAVYVVLRRARR